MHCPQVAKSGENQESLRLDPGNFKYELSVVLTVFDLWPFKMKFTGNPITKKHFKTYQSCIVEKFFSNLINYPDAAIRLSPETALVLKSEQCNV